jgi:GR25 family glycosyltransferase involved in LPS biosynthesis
MLYSYLLNNDYDEVIVMEDDVSPTIQNKTQLFDTIHNGKVEFPGAEMFILHGKNPKLHNIPLVCKEYFTRYQKPPWGNMLLYLKKSAINTLHNFLCRMICPADHPQKILFALNQLDVVVANKQLCVHNTVNSYIGNDLRFTKQVRTFIP